MSDTNRGTASSIGRLDRSLAWVSTVLWLASLVGPVDNIIGIQLAIGALTDAFAMLSVGPWAALANLTIPWGCIAIVSGSRSSLPVGLSVALVSTSPGFWILLPNVSVKTWAVAAWAASILMVTAAWWIRSNDQTIPDAS